VKWATNGALKRWVSCGTKTGPKSGKKSFADLYHGLYDGDEEIGL
jgi:hypothetical protein